MFGFIDWKNKEAQVPPKVEVIAPFEVKGVPKPAPTSQLLVDLQSLKELLTPLEHWIQGRHERVRDNGDLAFCLWGAAYHVTPGLSAEKSFTGHVSWPRRRRTRLIKALVREILPKQKENRVGWWYVVTRFNDYSDHRRVLKLIDKAIATEKERIGA